MTDRDISSENFVGLAIGLAGGRAAVCDAGRPGQSSSASFAAFRTSSALPPVSRVRQTIGPVS